MLQRDVLGVLAHGLNAAHPRSQGALALRLRVQGDELVHVLCNPRQHPLDVALVVAAAAEAPHGDLAGRRRLTMMANWLLPTFTLMSSHCLALASCSPCARATVSSSMACGTACTRRSMSSPAA